MDFQALDTLSIILGFLATFLFAECIILFIKGHSLKNKMDAEIESIRHEEKLKSEKREAELEIAYKERDLELKAEYEDLLSAARSAKRELDEKAAELDVKTRSAARAAEISEMEYTRYARMKEDCSVRAREYADKLVSISRLSPEEIRREAKITIEKKCEEDLRAYREEILKERSKNVEDEAKRILADAMQRISAKHAQETSTCIIKIPDEAMKGRLIGKDGRNIRSFEALTGATLIIDETPDSVMISCFDPARRETAKLALEALIKDGRINPSTIEEHTAWAKAEIAQSALKWGRDAAESIGITKISDEVAELLGRLNLHLSLNQNTLEHSLEVAKLCGLIAAELNCDVNLAKRAGLFHDIGKTCEASEDFSHARAAAKILADAGESADVINAVESHHNEVIKTSLTASILQIADTLSGSRPGARMEATEGYIQRIKMLENIALSFEGVSSAYAIQAGREVRVIVSPELLSDVETAELVKKIRSQIESTMESAIPIKVTVIREQRFTLTAKPTL